MLIHRALTAMLSLTSLCIVTGAQADNSAVQKAIEKQYVKMTQGLKARSIKPLQDVTTTDYTLTAPGGKVVTRQQVEAQITTQLTFLQAITDVNEKMGKLTVKGNEAKVEVQQILSGVVADMQTQGKVHKIDTVSQLRDTWVKSGANWLRKHSDLVTIAMTMDGKVVDVKGLMSGGPSSAKSGSASPNK